MATIAFRFPPHSIGLDGEPETIKEFNPYIDFIYHYTFFKKIEKLSNFESIFEK